MFFCTTSELHHHSNIVTSSSIRMYSTYILHYNSFLLFNSADLLKTFTFNDFQLLLYHTFVFRITSMQICLNSCMLAFTFTGTRPCYVLMICMFMNLKKKY